MRQHVHAQLSARLYCHNKENSSRRPPHVLTAQGMQARLPVGLAA